MSADVIEHTFGKKIRTTSVSDNFSKILQFKKKKIILQDKHNIRALSVIKYMCTRCEIGKKSSPNVVYLSVS